MMHQLTRLWLALSATELKWLWDLGVVKHVHDYEKHSDPNR